MPHGEEDYIAEEPILRVFQAKHVGTSDSPNSKAETFGHLHVLEQNISSLLPKLIN